MATVSKKYIIDLMLKEKLPYFRVQDTRESVRCIAENDSEDDVDSAIELLEESLGEVEDSYVYISVSTANRAEKGKGGDKLRYKNYQFRVNLLNAVRSGSKQASEAAPMNGKVLELIKQNNELLRKIERLEDQRRYDDLERQLKEIKNGSPLDKLLNNEKFINGIFGGEKTTIGLAGANDGEVNEDAVDRQTRLRKALTRLGKIDNKVDEHIEMLADFAEKDKAKYFQSISMLKTML